MLTAKRSSSHRRSFAAKPQNGRSKQWPVAVYGELGVKAVTTCKIEYEY